MFALIVISVIIVYIALGILLTRTFLTFCEGSILWEGDEDSGDIMVLVFLWPLLFLGLLFFGIMYCIVRLARSER